MLSSVGEGWCNWDVSQWPIQSVLFLLAVCYTWECRECSENDTSHVQAPSIHACRYIGAQTWPFLYFKVFGCCNWEASQWHVQTFKLSIARCLDVATGSLPNGMFKVATVDIEQQIKQCCAHPAPIRQDGRQTPQTRNKCVQRFGAC